MRNASSHALNQQGNPAFRKAGIVKQGDHFFNGTATVENAVLIPLTTIILLICLKLCFLAYNTVILESLGMRGALKAQRIAESEMSSGLREERTADLQTSLSKRAGRSVFLMPAPKAEVSFSGQKVSARFVARDNWSLPYFNEKFDIQKTEEFTLHSPADFIRLTRAVDRRWNIQDT